MTKKQKKNLTRIIIALVLFAVVFTLDRIFTLATVIDWKYSWILPFVLYLCVYIIIGHDVIRKAFKNIGSGNFMDENFLMVVATLGAFALAIFRGFKYSKGLIPGSEIEGFDEACAVILFYQVGEFFQDYAVGKSRKSISSLMDIRPDTANKRIDENTVETVSPDEISIDDVIVVNPGEKIPLDGIVIKGSTSVDTKALTGESLPRDTVVGDEVISGTVNLTSTIEIRVTKEFYDSTVSKILDLVENATDQKSKAENFITKFAKYYTPIVVFSALALAIVPPVVTGIVGNGWNSFDEWIYRALSFLVVSCPCALVISIPLSFFAGIGAASRYGILIKGSNYLEKFNNANIFVFDKTGTLTKGNFAVTEIEPKEREEEILRYAAIAEHGSSHPIARSIIKRYGSDSEQGYTITNEAGFGITAINGNDVILCGNSKLMEKNAIGYNEPSEIGTVVYVARNGEYLGSILISDEIKEETPVVIEELRKMGSKAIMLTGDNERIASRVSERIGLSSYRASLLPQNKVSEVEKLLDSKNDGDVLCFVGDGINDAPVLMRSDIGIAMGGVGSDAAIEASDIVLMEDDLRGISIAKKIARKTMIIVKENICFALGVKLIILLLSALGIASMWLAIFGDVGVAVLAILNAIRVNTKYDK